MFGNFKAPWKSVKSYRYDNVSATIPAVGERRPRLLVHAGLHKTGTSSIQSFLALSTDELRERGILYPRNGESWYISWQMTRDRRFLPSSGIDALAEEIAGFKGDVILSSEDFEGIIDEPERFEPLRFHPAFRDREFIVIIYVRNQAAYVESLYFELLKHGMGQEFIRFLQPILQNSNTQFQDWTFHFDYAQICKKWSGCSWGHLVVRNYHQLSGGSVVTDFCDLVLPNFFEKAAATGLRVNAREPLQVGLTRFYSNRVQRELKECEQESIAKICEAVSERPVAMANEFRQLLEKTFGQANKSLCSRVGMPWTGLTDMERAPDEAILMKDIFSFETHNMIAANESDLRSLQLNLFSRRNL